MSHQVPQLTADEWYVYVCLDSFVSSAELSAVTGISEPEIARHLATLQEQRLIHQEDRQGTTVYQRSTGSPQDVSSRSTAPVAPAEGAARSSDSSVPDKVAPSEKEPTTARQPESWFASLAWKDPDHAPRLVRGRVADAALVLATVVALVSAVLLASDDPDADSPSPPGSSPASENRDGTRQAADPEDPADTPAPAADDLQLRPSSRAGEPFESIPIQGRYAGADAGTALTVQRRQDGEWVSFPLPAVTDEDGSFSTRVELGPGRYRLRVADLESDVVSDVIVMRIG